VKDDNKGGVLQHLVGGEKGPTPRRQMLSRVLELVEKDLTRFHM
jgi:hypothetical protein